MTNPEDHIARSAAGVSPSATRAPTLDAQAELTPPAADARFCAVFDSSGEALVVVDAQGLVGRANRRARELLRLKEADISHAGLGDFLSHDSAAEFEVLRRHARTAHAIRFHPSRILDGSLATGFPIRITPRAAMPGSQDLLFCLEECSGVQRADEKWHCLEAELSTVLDSVNAGVILFDPAGHVRYSNARAMQLLGLGARKPKEIEEIDDLEQSVAGSFNDPGIFAAPWKSFLAGKIEPRHDELELLRPGRRVLERFSRPVLDAAGRSIGWLEVYSDVTGARHDQSKLLQTEKMAALGQLVSGIAHELNNPLTAIMGYAQLLLGHGLLPSQLGEAGKVFQEAERARRIVKNLLYFARENKPERTRVNLNEIVERTLALRSYEFKIENIQIHTDLSPDLPETMADPCQLQQVTLNLLVNAEQALLQDRGQGTIWIRTRYAGNRISLEISDDGPGIPREISSRIFDPFFTTKPPGIGTGLGLSIVYGIVQQHDGEVTFENLADAGAKFVVELPMIEVPAGSRGTALPLPPGEAALTGAGRILVVEDEMTVAQLIVDVLQEEGHQVEAVFDSQEGLTYLARSSYDLVICDLRMPRLDGPAFFDALIRSGSPMKDRIIFVTGDTLAPRTLEFLEPRGLPYLAKPFLVEELKLAVNGLLERTRAASNGNQTRDKSKIPGAVARVGK